jgi:hypothetical protein
MSLKITALTRQSPAPCQHLTLTSNDNGTINVTHVSIPAIKALFDQFPGGSRGALLFAWAQDRMDRGSTLNQLVNVEIESVIV